MWKTLKIQLLKRLYRLLIIDVSFIDKHKLKYYHNFKLFAQLTLNTTKGEFNFEFKEDRRAKVRTLAPQFMMRSYFVELILPDHFNSQANELKGRVAIVLTLRPLSLNYEAMSAMLLDLYLDTLDKLTPTSDFQPL